MDTQLNADEFEKYTWEVIRRYFQQERGDYIISHNITSYNDFISKKIHEIIDGFNPIIIGHKYIINHDLYQYEMQITINNIQIKQPIVTEKNGRIHIMTPNLARNRNMTYASNITVDMNIESIYVEFDDDSLFNVVASTTTNQAAYYRSGYAGNHSGKPVKTHKQSKILTGIQLCKLPIMVKSAYCHLRNNDNMMIMDPYAECRYDNGGYFIINGMEKVVVAQDRISENKPYVFRDNKTTYEFVAEIRSVCESVFSPPKLTTLKLSSKSTQFGRYIRVCIHHIKADIPLFIIFRALGVESDKDILKYIFYDMDERMCIQLKGSIADSNNILYQNNALEYLSKYLSMNNIARECYYNPHKKIDAVRDILRNDLFPHVGEDYKCKALFLGSMVAKLIRCSLGIVPLDDRDSYINKRIDTPGIMLANLFRQYYGKLVKEFKVFVLKEYRDGSWRVSNDFVNIINKNNISQLFKSTTITNGVNYCFGTGNWGAKNQGKANKVGVAQVLNRFNRLATLSHCNRIYTPVEKTGKLLNPRKLHNSQWGVICPCETPEGSPIGLVKNSSIYGTITVSSDPIVIHERLYKLGVNQFINAVDKLAFLSEMADKHNVIININGDIIGYHSNPLYIYNKLKQFKRTGIINIHTSIYWNYRDGIIYINTQGGRSVRPLYIVDNDGKLRFNKYDIVRILNRGNKYKFHHLLRMIDMVRSTGDIYSDDINIDTSLIEYLDVEEVHHTITGLYYKDIGSQRYQYLEIHPSLVLGICASNIPFPGHNQAPRNAYQSCMVKQSIGVYATNFNKRMDTLAHVLMYPEKPIVRSKIADYTLTDELPYGANVMVAIMTYTGYNQEDSLLIKRSAVERGMLGSTYYKTVKDKCNKVHSTGEEEYYTRPDMNASVTKGLKPYNYSKLDKSGFVPENTYVTGGDVIIGKVMPHRNGDVITFSDSSIAIKNGDSGFIDRNYKNGDDEFANINSDGYVFTKVRLRIPRYPTIGDKCCIRDSAEVLTDRGWMRLADIDISQHKIMTIKDGIKRYMYAADKPMYKCDGEILYMFNIYNRDDIVMVYSKDHRIIVKIDDAEKFRFITAEKLAIKIRSRQCNTVSFMDENIGEIKFRVEEIAIDEKLHFGDIGCLTIPDAGVFLYREYKDIMPTFTGNSSRHGQKGIIGMIYDDEDMPFTEDGITPDIIVNPHAIPSRMTIAQLLECILGKYAVSQGSRGYATAFSHDDIDKVQVIEEALVDIGMNRHGDEIMYNPRTGEQLQCPIFIGPTYYQRLKHMVDDKIHSRADNGPIVLMTHQSTEGRSREGGLRMGEMEVQCNWAHGIMTYLKGKLIDDADNYKLYICKKCGYYATINVDSNTYKCHPCGKNIADFSQIRLPYVMKLLMQLLESIGINIKIITE
jgi:DNA-directed RNA polymerase II subunit RPB2